MSHCFEDNPGLRSFVASEIGMEGFSKTTNIDFCFKNCSAVTNIDLSGTQFGTAVTGTLEGCFCGCIRLTTLSLPDDFGANATEIIECFRYCPVQSLNLNGFGAAATNLDLCFAGCGSLTKITGKPQFKASVSFAYCPLDNNSIKRVVEGLQVVESTQILTISVTTKESLTEAGLFDELVATASGKGWTLTT